MTKLEQILKAFLLLVHLVGAFCIGFFLIPFLTDENLKCPKQEEILLFSTVEKNGNLTCTYMTPPPARALTYKKIHLTQSHL